VPRSPKGNDIVVDTAKGCWITSIEGKKYLDLQTGIGVANTGHCHPKVVAAIQEQAAKGIHLQQNCTISKPVVALLERLDKVTPPEVSRFFFNGERGGRARATSVLSPCNYSTSVFSSTAPCSACRTAPPPDPLHWPTPLCPAAVSGTEACESAVKLARHETGRQNVIVFRGGFHGRSLGALAMTSSKTAYGVGYGPLPSGFHHTAFPTCVHCTCAGKAGAHSPGAAEAAGTTFTCCGFAMESLQQLLKEVSDPKDTAAIMLEPILGEGGYIAPPPGFMRELRALCDKHGMLLIADEVQSGVGRTGKFWAMEHEGVVPDITVFAKGIASGIPLSGIATRGDMMRKSPPGSMGGTYGANAVAAAAAVATIDAIVEEGMLANAAARGAQLQAGLRRLAAKHPEHTLDVRGRGCMVGWEFNMPAGSGFAGHVTACAMEEGALLLTSVRS
jgi:4-aminobutyrate aminotransferase